MSTKNLWNWIWINNLLIFTVIVIILTLSSAVVSQLGLFHLNISKITSIIIIHGNVLLVLPKPQQHAWHMFQVNQKSCKHWYWNFNFNTLKGILISYYFYCKLCLVFGEICNFPTTAYDLPSWTDIPVPCCCSSPLRFTGLV